ncbi:MAG: response regulator transcription factor [Aureispira sp.]|nr:response regulator transcription factor [Aureispira sp.]
MKIKTLIVDDEQPARLLLQNYVERMPQLELVAMCKNPLEALDLLQKETIDLLLLDIQMPELMGTDLLKSIPQQPLVIFTTAYQEYALEGYELDVVDYMLKPISFNRFLKGVNKAVELFQLRQQEGVVVPVATDATLKKDYIVIKANQRLYRMRYNDILYIQGLKEYVTFYTKEQKLVVHGALKYFERELPSTSFLRVHKSYIVNKNKVNNLYGNQLEIDKTQIPIGYTYRQTVLNELF